MSSLSNFKIFSVKYHIIFKQRHFASFPIWVHFIYFSFLISIGRTSKTCWIIKARVDILVLFLILEEMFSIFHHWEWCLLWLCHIWTLLCWGMLLLRPLLEFSFCLFFLLLFFNRCWILSKVFSVSIDIVIWLLFKLLLWCITLIDLRILKNSCIPGINSTWLWYMILLMYIWIWFS